MRLGASSVRLQTGQALPSRSHAPNWKSAGIVKSLNRAVCISCLDLLMKQAGITAEIRPEISASLLKAEMTGGPAGAMRLPDGRVITGKTSDILGAAAALLLNALKAMGGIDDQFDLISTDVLKPVCDLKTRYLHHKNPRLHTDEVLMALTISSLTNPMAQVAKEQLSRLSDAEAHFSVIISDEDEKLLKRLGISVTCEPRYESNRLYHK